MSQLNATIKDDSPPYDRSTYEDYLGKTPQLWWEAEEDEDYAAASVKQTSSTIKIPERARVDSLYHFVKGQKNIGPVEFTGQEKHLFVQYEDTDVVDYSVPLPSIPLLSSAKHVLHGFNPASISEDAVDRQIPASWADNKDFCMYSAGTMQHAVFAGDDHRTMAIHLTTDPAALAAWERPGWNDVWDNLSDNDEQTYADLYYLGGAAHTLWIVTPTPATKFNFLFQNGQVNSNAATPSILYWTSAGFKAASISSDSTAVAGVPFYQNGSIEFSCGSDEIPGFFFGIYGYVYVLDMSAQMSASTYAWSLTYSNNEFWPIENLWNSLGVDIIEAQFYDQSAGTYATYPASSVNISSMQASNDKLHMAMMDIPQAVYIDVSGTPNTNTTAVILNFKYHTSKTGVGSVNIPFYDGTNGLTQSGWVYFDEAVVRNMKKQLFLDNKNPMYWIEMMVGTHDLSDAIIAGIQYAPVYNIKDFGSFGQVNASWKGRSLYTYAGSPNIYVSQKDTVNVLNGTDFAILQPGDGRNNRVTCMKNFENEILVWQEELGKEGGCLTLFEGYNPATFGRLVLSTKIGTFSAKTATVVDSSAITVRTDLKNQMVAFFISRYGVFMTTGTTVMRISQDIDNYFDPDFEECIREGYGNRHWISFDENRQCLRLGLVSGKNAEECNVFPVYFLADGTWGFDVYASGRQPSCMINADGSMDPETDYGNENVDSVKTDKYPVLQYAGSIYHSCVYRMNTGKTDCGLGIDGRMQVELNGDGFLIDLREVHMRARSQSTGSLEKKIYENGVLVEDESNEIDLQPEATGESCRRHWVLQRNYITPGVSILFEQTDVDVEPGDSGTTFYLYDMTTYAEFSMHK